MSSSSVIRQEFDAACARKNFARAFDIAFNAGYDTEWRKAHHKRRKAPGPVRATIGSWAAPSRANPAELMADLSSNNGSFDPHAYSSAGHLIVALKATQGTGYTNPLWNGWAIGSHRANLAVAHYHFYDLGDPIAEAQHFCATIRPHFKPSRDRVVLDLETGARALWSHYAQAFYGEVKRLLGVDTILYSMLSAIGGDIVPPGGMIWPAAWGSVRPSVAGATVWAWQYTDGSIDPAGGPTRAAGVPSSCDMSLLSPTLTWRLRKALGR